MIGNMFTFFSQNVKRGVAGYQITFTVKEWMLDPDNSFADTEVTPLEAMTVKIGTETKQTNASGVATFTLENGVYTYEVYANNRYLTTYRDEFTVAGAAQSIAVKCYACLYNPLQVWDLINNENYVPVASGAELDSLRNTGSKTMGGKTIFVGNYTTGLDKKYVQVKQIDLSSFANWNPIQDIANPNTAFTGGYDGNMLYVTNMTFSKSSGSNGMFWRVSGSDCFLRNILLYNINHTHTGTSQGGGLAGSIFNSVSVSDCRVVGVVTGINSLGGFCGISGTTGILGGVFENCSFSGTVTATGNNIGGFSPGDGNISSYTNCSSSGSVTGGRYVGGFMGFTSSNSTFTKCYSTSDVISTSNITSSIVGGFIGDNGNGTYSRCYATGNVSATGTARIYVGGFMGAQEGAGTNTVNCYATGSVSGTQYVGGFCGRKFAGSMSNCYSIGAVSGTTNIGGFMGLLAGTLTNSYYDSQKSGQSDTGKGLPRTTAQMKAGTASSFILPNGDIDPDSLAANAMYTAWDTAIWDFLTTNDYPILK